MDKKANNQFNDGAWTSKEITLLRKKYNTCSRENLLILFPKRTWASLRHKASRLKLNFGRKWTKKEEDILRKYFPTNPASYIAKLTGRPEESIRVHRRLLGMKAKQRLIKWTKSEKDYLRKWHGRKDVLEISENLNRSLSGVIWMKSQLGLKNTKFNDFELGFENWLKSEKIKYDSQVRFDRFIIDFVLENAVVELNGEHVHVNRLTNKGPYTYNQKLRMKSDARKIKLLKKLGYQVIIIWRADWLKYKKAILKELPAVLKSNLKEYNSTKSVKLLKGKHRGK